MEQNSDTNPVLDSNSEDDCKDMSAVHNVVYKILV